MGKNSKIDWEARKSTEKDWFKELEEARRISRYRNTDSSMVDQAYINSFFKDAQNYFNTASSDYDSLTWGTAEDVYNSRNQAWADLSSRADAIGAYWYKNRNNYTADAYKQYQDYLDSFYSGGQSIVDLFKNNSDDYKQWATQEDYDLWKADEDEYARVRALPEFSKYTNSDNQKAFEIQQGLDILKNQGGLAGSDAIADRNVNIERIKKYLDPEDLAIYYYYLENEPEKAEAYYNKISNQATYESAKAKSQNYNQTGLEFWNSLVAGVDSFSAGMKNVGNVVNGILWGTEAEEIQPSVSQYAFDIMRQDNKYLWAVANDLAQTIGNQLPSMVLNAAAPGAGLVTMGASAGGNAYSDFKALGYSEAQSVAYGITIGTLEAKLQEIMGGIPGLGSKGGIVAGRVKKVLPNITKGLARGALALGGRVADEAIEEMTQTALEPILQHMFSGGKENFIVDWDDPNAVAEFGKYIEEILYSGMLGGLSAGILEGVPNGINTLQLNQQYSKAYSKNPEALKTLLEGIATNNPNVDISKIQSKVDNGTKISGNQIRNLLYQTEVSTWNKDQANLLAGIEDRLTELGEQNNVKQLAQSIVNARYGNVYDAITNAEEVVRKTKGADATTFQDAMADYVSDQSNLNKKDKQNIKNSEYGRRVSNEANPDNAETHSSNWAKQLNLSRMGKGSGELKRNRVALAQLKRDFEDKKVLNSPENAISYRNNIITPTLTKEGVQAKEKDLEGIANNRGYKGTTNEAFIKGYKGENLEEYQLGFDEAYRMGRTMVRKEELQNAVFKSYINEEAQMSAYNSGYTEAKYESMKKAEGKVKTEKTKGGFTVTVPLSNEALTKSRKTAIEFFKVVADIANANIKVVEDAKNHGLYDPKTNTISIDVNLGGKDFMVYSLSHELTHRIREALPKQFDDFAKMLFEAVGEKMSITERIKLWEKNNKQYYPKLTPAQLNDLAYEEVVCEMCESFLTDEVVARKFSEKVQKENKTLWEKIKDFFTDLINRLKEAYEGLDPQSENGRLVREMTNDLTKVKEAWAELVIESGKAEKVVSESEVKKSAKDFEKLDADYLSAVERGDMEAAQKMVDEVANATMPDSKIRTEDGKLRVVYHGTNTGDFTVFNPDYIGMSSGDDGFFGMGFYFAYSKGEASYYGSSRVIPAYLNLKNPFNFEKELQSYQGKRASGGYAPDAVALMNFADKFPEIAKNVKIGVVENESDTVEDISLVEFSKAFKDVIENKTFEYREVENEFGEKETVVTADAKTVEYQYDGKKYSYTDYGFQKRFWGTPNELDVAYEYLANSVYEYVDMIPRTRLILDNNREFTDALKDMGYDGTIQSEYGDEAVAFYPNQIKSADPVTYDDEGNVIPLSQRFNAENEDIRYSKKNLDTANKKAYNKRKKLYTDEFATNAMIWSRSAGTMVGEQNIFYRNGKWVLVEKTDDYFVELGAYSADQRTEILREVKEYNETLREDIHSYLVRYESERGYNMRDYGDAEWERYGDGRSGIIYQSESQGNGSTDNKSNEQSDRDKVKHSRKTVDPITSRELLAKALTKVAKGDEKVLLEQYKSNLRMIEGEMGNLKNLRKEIDAIKYKKSITYKGENLSVKEFEQRAYTQAETMGVNAENVKFKAHKDTGKYVATVDGKVILEADKAFRSKEEADHINTLEHNYQATLVRISKYDASLLRIEAMQPMKQLLTREKAKAYKEAEAKGKEALKEYKAQAIEQQKAITQRYQEMRHKNVEQRATTEMRHKLMNTVHTLDQLLVNPTKKKHIPIGLQKPVAEALNILNMDTVGAEERLAKITAELKVTDDPYEMEMLLERYNRIKAQGDKIKEKIDSLKSAYAEILNSEDDIIRNSYDEVIANTIEQVASKVGDTPVRDMAYDQLESLYKMYRMILKTIRDANKSFTMAKGEEISTLGQNVMSEVAYYERKDKAVLPALEKGLQFTWNNLKPVYAFERIGSSTLTELYNNVRHGEDVWAVDMQEARAYSDAQKVKYGYKSWNMEKTYTFHTPLGKEFKLNLGQIMSIYAYTRRGEQAIEHLINGGFVYDGVTIVEKKIGDKIKVDAELKDSTAYRLDEAVIGQINATLTKEQREFAEAMQKYLSETMGEKGNEVSLALYDIKIFGEKNYFPLKSSQVFLERAREQARGEVKIKNKGFTKETTPRANNPITLTSFMDVWANHCIEMSMYHAFTLPLEDFYRVYNYKERATDEKDTESVIMNLENAYGNSVTSYIDQLLVDLNGGLRTDPRAGVLGGTIAAFKKASTMASLSVVVQQPSSIIRAMSMVGAKYFIDKPSKYTHTQTWEEVKKYAPVAVIKEMGYFDVGLGKTSQEWLKNDPTKYEQFEEKWLTRAPALADEMGWNILWKAIKRETVAKHPELKFNSEEFLNECGRRFTEVVTMTQVYDSVFSRSANMRSKDTGMKMVTSFMAESTTISNMFEYAVLEALRGNKKALFKNVGAIVFSSLVNAIAVSFVYAARDDDDEEYWNKYLKKFVDNFGSNLNPVAWIPIGRDIMSLIEGYDIERADMSLISDFISAIRRLSSTRAEAEEKVAGLIGAIANLFGIPLKNLYRDAKAIWNLFTK